MLPRHVEIRSVLKIYDTDNNSGEHLSIWIQRKRILEHFEAMEHALLRLGGSECVEPFIGTSLSEDIRFLILWKRNQALDGFFRNSNSFGIEIQEGSAIFCRGQFTYLLQNDVARACSEHFAKWMLRGRGSAARRPNVSRAWRRGD